MGAGFLPKASSIVQILNDSGKCLTDPLPNANNYTLSTDKKKCIIFCSMIN